jgi:hypothetical protein
MKRRRHAPEQIIRKPREAGPEGVGAGNLVESGPSALGRHRLQRCSGVSPRVSLPAGRPAPQHPTPSASPARPALVLRAELRRSGSEPSVLGLPPCPAQLLQQSGR